MALMILAHPDFGHSIANKSIVEQLAKEGVDLEVRNIHQLYPDYCIDIHAEQAALLWHDLIILQYPMYWFNMPAILKHWFDQVFAYQFAYGPQGNKLKNKKIMVSLTVGQPEVNIKEKIDDFLKPLQCSAEYAQMTYLEPLIQYGVSNTAGYSEADIIEKAKQHAKQLQNKIERCVGV